MPFTNGNVLWHDLSLCVQFNMLIVVLRSLVCSNIFITENTMLVKT